MASEKSSGEIERDNNVPYYTLRYLLRTGRVPKPQKSGDGRLRWTAEDEARLREVLETRGQSR